ncbi:hypothetical protein LshimejAT787_0603040 [Lyophyllum shimeji]|uniref:Uncharacterized protein n=1 Tax=Lyophyllum shimeji TaxID=47721 RepID=A0A9P3PMM4_LYOSH|nr:hypothetical protein LshimejAT787_0603040 [Lyophyllum shimeji]
MTESGHRHRVPVTKLFRYLGVEYIVPPSAFRPPVLFFTGMPASAVPGRLADSPVDTRWGLMEVLSGSAGRSRDE